MTCAKLAPVRFAARIYDGTHQLRESERKALLRRLRQTACIHRSLNILAARRVFRLQVRRARRPCRISHVTGGGGTHWGASETRVLRVTDAEPAACGTLMIMRGCIANMPVSCQWHCQRSMAPTASHEVMHNQDRSSPNWHRVQVRDITVACLRFTASVAGSPFPMHFTTTVRNLAQATSQPASWCWLWWLHSGLSADAGPAFLHGDRRM